MGHFRDVANLDSYARVQHLFPGWRCKSLAPALHFLGLVLLESHVVIPTDLYNAIVCGLSVATCWQVMSIIDAWWKRRQARGRSQ